MGIRHGRAALGVAGQRGAIVGATTGFVVGGVAGTWAFPLVVTFLWGVEGAAAGAVTGSVLGVALHLVSRMTGERSPALAGLARRLGSVAAARRPPTGWVRPLVSGSVLTGAVIGAATGLGLGVFAYLPTAPVAMVEGALLGATSGLLVATLVATAVLVCRTGGRTVRVRRDASGRMEP